MPTSPRVRYKGRGRTGGVEPRPYGTVCRGGRPCPPAPDNATPCRAGPVCPAGCGKNLSGRRGRRPLRMGCKKCVGEGLCPSRGRGRTPPLRKFGKKCGTAESRGPAARKKARREPSFFMCCGDGVCIRLRLCKGGQYRVPSLLKARMRQSTPRRSR